MSEEFGVVDLDLQKRIVTLLEEDKQQFQPSMIIMEKVKQKKLLLIQEVQYLKP